MNNKKSSSLKKDFIIVVFVLLAVIFRREIIAGLPTGMTDIFLRNDERIFDLSDKIRISGIPAVKDTGHITDSLGVEPMFTKKDKSSTENFIVYQKVDMLKRPGQVFTCLSSKNLSENVTEPTKVTPTGWKETSYPKIIPDWKLYRKIHTISSRLFNSEKDDRENTITCTQYAYEYGIKKQEDKVIKYLKKHPENHVLYRMTPVYINGDKIAKHFVIEAYSIEDKGKLSICNAVHNEQPGVSINYKTGESSRVKSDSISKSEKQLPIPNMKKKSDKKHKKKTGK